MSSTSAQYFMLMLGTFGLFWGVRRQRWARIATLLGASLIFYAAWKWQPLVVFFGIACVNFLGGQALARFERPWLRKAVLAAAVTLHMGALFTYKYLDLVLRTLGDLGRLVHAEHPPEPVGLLLPIGLSFVSFQAVSYIVDVYRGDTSGRRSLFHNLLFLLFFPKMVVGPIARANVLMDVFDHKPKMTPEEGAQGLFRIAQGVAKKLLIADVMAVAIVNPVFSNPTGYSSIECVLGAIAYTFQIYFDFSASSDIAIGTAALFGFKFHENFDKPYHARNLFEFWNRWHISLSTWLRDYFYRPLGGNKSGRAKTLRNLMLVMSFGGLWHGADWKFMIWGGIHGVLLIITRLKWWRFGKPDYTKWWNVVIGWTLMFIGVVFPRVFFRADSITGALTVYHQMLRFLPGVQRVSSLAWLSMGAGLVFYFLPRPVFTFAQSTFVKLPVPARAVALVALGLLIKQLANVETQPYIYGQF